ncbi:hypothetical protein JHK87_000187 [Glycine soja]|nr:hypothetical protein JHK87_000187 [Glycine soja]
MYSVYSLWEFVKDIGEKKDSGLLNARILNQFSSSFSRLRKRKLFSLLHDRKTEEAWLTYSHSTHLLNSTCLSRLVFQLSYHNTLSSLTRAQSIIMCLRNEGQLHCFNAKCLVLLAVSVTMVNHTLYAASFLRFMLRSSYLPHVKA